MNNFTNFTEYNRNLHFNTCFNCRINTGCVTILAVKHGSDEKTAQRYCANCAPALHSYGDTPAEQTPFNTDTQKRNHLGRYYLLSEHFALHELSTCGYNGVGNGFIVVDKETGIIDRLSYADDGRTIQHEPDVMYRDDAGRVLWQNDKQICITCNFNNWAAWLS